MYVCMYVCMYITVYVFDTVSRLLLSMGTAKLDHPFSGYQQTTTGTTTQLAVSPALSASCWCTTVNLASTTISIGVPMTAPAPSYPSLVQFSFFLSCQLSLLNSVTCFSLLPLSSFTVFLFLSSPLCVSLFVPLLPTTSLPLSPLLSSSLPSSESTAWLGR